MYPLFNIQRRTVYYRSFLHIRGVCFISCNTAMLRLTRALRYLVDTDFASRIQNNFIMLNRSTVTQYNYCMVMHPNTYIPYITFVFSLLTCVSPTEASLNYSILVNLLENSSYIAHNLPICLTLHGSLVYSTTPNRPGTQFVLDGSKYTVLYLIMGGCYTVTCTRI